MDYLTKQGLTNQNTESLANISMGKRSDYIPFCGSGVNAKCGLGRSSNTLLYKMVQKEVMGEPKFCPDCGYALIWKRKKSFLD